MGGTTAVITILNYVICLLWNKNIIFSLVLAHVNSDRSREKMEISKKKISGIFFFDYF